jgi:hypothetical protein
MYLPKIIILNDKLYYYRINRKGQLTSENGKNIYFILQVFKHLQNKINHGKMKKLILADKFIIRKQVAILFICMLKIQYKYKKDFLFKASNLIFNNNKVSTIYKTMLLTKYINSFSCFIAPIAVILFHGCYLWQKLSFKNIKKYFASKFKSLIQ